LSAATTLDVTEDDLWDAIMDVSAKAVFFESQVVLPALHGRAGTTG
jgi:hypothetical protein